MPAVLCSDEEFAEAWESGVAMQEIADRFGYASRANVSQRAHDMRSRGWDLRVNRPRPKRTRRVPPDDADAAERLERDAAHIDRLRALNGAPSRQQDPDSWPERIAVPWMRRVLENIDFSIRGLTEPCGTLTRHPRQREAAERLAEARAKVEEALLALERGGS